MSEITKYAHQNDLATVDLVDGWLEYERQDGASGNTLHAYHKGIRVWAGWLEDHNHGDLITPADVRQFKSDLADRYSAQTVNLRLSAVRSFYRWMVVIGHMSVNPADQVKGVKRPKSRTHKRDALTSGEVRAVLDTCQTGTLEGTRDLAIVTLMAYCGLRTVEINRANIGNLGTNGERLTLAVQGKGRLEADEIVIVPANQEHVVRSWLVHRSTFAEHGRGDPLFVSLSNQNRGARLSTLAIRVMVKMRYGLAGVVVERKSTHSLRHSAITSAIRHGAAPMAV